MKKKMLRQGDVGLEIVKGKIDFGNYKKLDKEGLVLALGEVTGHKHQIVAEKKDDVEVYENPIEKILNVKEEATLYHGTEEQIKFQVDMAKTGVIPEIWTGDLDTHTPHKPIRLPKGIYRVRKQREFDPKGDQLVKD